MQLGTRWAAAVQPPATVPAQLHEAIAAASADAPDAHWTLTWLEGRPIAELDTGIEVTELVDGTVVTRPWSD
ncbi:hypothetical protein [Microbacterium gorillae]|uniref:hypothetical protein n=1 Tax=Microbacterium gorillae TaxID=1231063 RepID=UPI00058EB9F7|nr:hypothetical protein [Microbacterium gorillae]